MITAAMVFLFFLFFFFYKHAGKLKLPEPSTDAAMRSLCAVVSSNWSSFEGHRVWLWLEPHTEVCAFDPFTEAADEQQGGWC